MPESKLWGSPCSTSQFVEGKVEARSYLTTPRVKRTMWIEVIQDIPSVRIESLLSNRDTRVEESVLKISREDDRLGDGGSTGSRRYCHIMSKAICILFGDQFHTCVSSRSICLIGISFVGGTGAGTSSSLRKYK